MSSPKFCTAARSTLRPIRPKPLMPTLIAMSPDSRKEMEWRRSRPARPNQGILTCLDPHFSPWKPAMRRATVFFLAFFATIAAGPALAWSALGHQLVGELAERHLDPAA